VRPRAREHEVVDELLLGEPDVGGHAVVADVFRRMTAEAVIDEVRGTTLQGSVVRDVDVGVVEVHLAAG
jgi:hypothetical protein